MKIKDLIKVIQKYPDQDEEIIVAWWAKDIVEEWMERDITDEQWSFAENEIVNNLGDVDSKIMRAILMEEV